MVELAKIGREPQEVGINYRLSWCRNVELLSGTLH